MRKFITIEGHKINTQDALKAFIINNFAGEDQRVALTILTGYSAIYADALKSPGFINFIKNDYLKKEEK